MCRPTWKLDADWVWNKFWAFQAAKFPGKQRRWTSPKAGVSAASGETGGDEDIARFDVGRAEAKGSKACIGLGAGVEAGVGVGVGVGCREWAVVGRDATETKAIWEVLLSSDG